MHSPSQAFFSSYSGKEKYVWEPLNSGCSQTCPSLSARTCLPTLSLQLIPVPDQTSPRVHQTYMYAGHIATAASRLLCQPSSPPPPPLILARLSFSFQLWSNLLEWYLCSRKIPTPVLLLKYVLCFLPVAFLVLGLHATIEHGHLGS